MVRISLIVSTYNRGEQLLRTLKSIASQDLDPALWEAVIVNNNSTDRTAELVNSFISANPGVPIRVVFEGRQGLSHARNRGIEESAGNIVVLADDDEELNPEFMRQYIDFFDSFPDALAAGGKIVPHYEYETPEWLSPYLERPLSAAIDLGEKVKLFKGSRYPIGGNMAFRRDVFTRYGNFNTELGRTGAKLLSGEEKDIFYRIKSDGGKIYWVPGPTIRHLIPQSRITRDYLVRLTRMIGISEQVRTKSKSRCSYYNRIAQEVIKWGGTFVLSVIYLFKLQPAKAHYLILMRLNITMGLLGKIQ